MKYFARGRDLVAFVCVLVAAFAALPLTAGAQTSPGTILFSRIAYDSQGNSTGSSIFSIADNDLNLKQLTPHVDGEYDIPSVSSTNSLWLTNAFKATLITYRRRHPPGLFAGRRAVGESRLAVC